MQKEFTFLRPLETANYIDDSIVRSFKSYREAVIYSWTNRTLGKGKSEPADQSMFASNVGYVPSHFSRCVNPYTKSPMDLKADFIATFEAYTGNRAVTQYCNMVTHTTSLEQIQAARLAA